MCISLYTNVHGATDGISGRMPRIKSSLTRWRINASSSSSHVYNSNEGVLESLWADFTHRIFSFHFPIQETSGMDGMKNYRRVFETL